MLKEEIIEILNLFDSYQIPEDAQKKLIAEGIYFNFTYGDIDYNKKNRKMDVFQFANLLKFCEQMNIALDANHMLANPWDSRYEKLIEAMEKIDNIAKNNEIGYSKIIKNN